MKHLHFGTTNKENESLWDGKTITAFAAMGVAFVGLGALACYNYGVAVGMDREAVMATDYMTDSDTYEFITKAFDYAMKDPDCGMDISIKNSFVKTVFPNGTVLLDTVCDAYRRHLEENNK